MGLGCWDAEHFPVKNTPCAVLGCHIKFLSGFKTRLGAWISFQNVGNGHFASYVAIPGIIVLCRLAQLVVLLVEFLSAKGNRASILFWSSKTCHSVMPLYWEVGDLGQKPTYLFHRISHCVFHFLQLAASCLNVSPQRRPTMSDVCIALEHLKTFGHSDGVTRPSSRRALLNDGKSSTTPCAVPSPPPPVQAQVAQEADEFYSIHSKDLDSETKIDMTTLQGPQQASAPVVVRQASEVPAQQAVDWVQFEKTFEEVARSNSASVVSLDAISEPGITVQSARGVGIKGENDANGDLDSSLRGGIVSARARLSDVVPIAKSGEDASGAQCPEVRVGHNYSSSSTASNTSGSLSASVTPRTVLPTGESPHDGQQQSSP